MTEHKHIIDVTPVSHSSSRIHFDREQAQRSCEGTAKASVSSPLAGIAQIALGVGLVAIGIPMLILPGPGLLAIGVGIVLAASGFAKVTGR